LTFLGLTGEFAGFLRLEGRKFEALIERRQFFTFAAPAEARRVFIVGDENAVKVREAK
jgi:hypothetical protein